MAVSKDILVTLVDDQGYVRISIGYFDNKEALKFTEDVFNRHLQQALVSASTSSPIIIEKKERINLLDGSTRRRVLRVFEEKKGNLIETAKATGLTLDIVSEYVKNAKRRPASSALNAENANFNIDSTALFAQTMGKAQLAQGDIASINPRLLEISDRFKKEIQDARTPEGRARLSKNWRGWVLPWVNLLDNKSLIADPLDKNGALMRENKVIRDVIDVATRARQEGIEAWVNIGIGGSDLPTQTLVKTSVSPYHNELSREARHQAPKVYFTGNDFSPDLLYHLLFNLDNQGILFKTMFNVVSKSGTTADADGRQPFRTPVAATTVRHPGAENSG